MAIILDKKQESYFKGEKVRKTGRKDDTTYSISLYEYIFLSGKNKDEIFWQPGN